MANKGTRPNALALLLNYDSDSDKDSGYTSEEERKRKQNFINPRERKSKKSKPGLDEEMIVDAESILGNGEKQKQTSFHSPNLYPCIENSESINGPKLEVEKDLMQSHHQISTHNSQRLVPLPEELLISQGHVDDPSLHQGRIRSFPHERGDWASMIFIPLTFGIFDPHLSSLLTVLLTACEDHNLKVFQTNDYHISLSQTFILRLEWIQPLIEELRQCVSKFRKFSTWLHGLAALGNEEKTRTFLALRVGHGKHEMRDIAEAADASLKQYKLSSFKCESWTFHVSIGWCHGDKVKELQKVIPFLQNLCDQYFDIESDMRTFNVSEIHVKTGNRIHRIPLGHS